MRRKKTAIMSINIFLLLIMVITVIPMKANAMEKEKTIGMTTREYNAITKENKTLNSLAKKSNEEFEKVFDEAIVVNDPKSEIVTNIMSESRSNLGKYPTRKGMILSTPDNLNKAGKVLGVGHAGILYAKKKTVESLAAGVKEEVNNWKERKNTKGKKIRILGGTVKKTSVKQDGVVANWCHKQIGKKYNLSFYNTNTRKKFYCSQLVWAGFKDNYNINLNTDRYDHFNKYGIKTAIAIAPDELLSISNLKKKKISVTYKKNSEPK